MMLPMHFDLSAVWHCVSGEGCVSRSGELLKGFGSKYLIVTGKTGAKKSGALDDFLKVFAEQKIEYRIFDGIPQNPHFDDCVRAVKSCDITPNAVLGIGGGSAMDAAKTVAVILANPTVQPEDLYAGNFNKPLPILACDTTAGTGSGVTRYSVMETGFGNAVKKAGYGHPSIMPSVSFCDPKYLRALPITVAQSTTVDIIAHCLEAYFHKKTGVLPRTYAAAGLELLKDSFARLIAGQCDDGDREKILYASQLGGMAIELTGTCMGHSQSYGITVQLDIPHGFACGYTLGDFLRLQATGYPDEVSSVLAGLGFADIDSFEQAVYSVLPPLPLTVEQIDSLTAVGEKSGHIFNSAVPGTPELSRVFYQNLAKRFA